MLFRLFYYVIWSRAIFISSVFVPTKCCKWVIRGLILWVAGLHPKYPLQYVLAYIQNAHCMQSCAAGYCKLTFPTLFPFFSPPSSLISFISSAGMPQNVWRTSSSPSTVTCGLTAPPSGRCSLSEGNPWITLTGLPSHALRSVPWVALLNLNHIEIWGMHGMSLNHTPCVFGLSHTHMHLLEPHPTYLSTHLVNATAPNQDSLQTRVCEKTWQVCWQVHMYHLLTWLELSDGRVA